MAGQARVSLINIWAVFVFSLVKTAVVLNIIKSYLRFQLMGWALLAGMARDEY